MTLHFEVEGRPDGPPLLLIHGFLSSALQWDRNRQRLGEHHRLVLVDQPGHGGSPAPDDPAAYGPERVLAELEEIRIGLGIDRWWVGGQSHGGAVVLRYALVHGDRCHGVVFTNSRAAFGLAAPQVDETPRRITEGIRHIRDVAVHPINARRFPEDLKNRMVEVADAVPLHVVGHVGAHRNSWALGDRLGDLTPPVLLVNGRFERRFQPCVDVARSLIPDLTVVDLDGGHSINVEAAAGFDEAVLRFTGALIDG